MIQDGYNRHARYSVGASTLSIVFRPATKDERRSMRYHAAFLRSASVARAFVNRFVAAHIIEPPMTPFDVNDLDEKAYEWIVKTVQGLIPDASGETWKLVEKQHEKNLIEGVMLYLTNPRLALRPCTLCKKLWYNEETGLPIIMGNDKPLKRYGPTLCETPEGCLKGTPENQKSLNLANRWAWQHYRECEAIGQFPDDPLVRKNAKLILAVLRKVQKKHEAAALAREVAKEQAKYRPKTQRVGGLVRMTERDVRI